MNREARIGGGGDRRARPVLPAGEGPPKVDHAVLPASDEGGLALGERHGGDDPAVLRHAEHWLVEHI